MDLAEFEDMWTSPPGRYALVRVKGEDPTGLGLLPLDMEAKAAVIVDVDDALAELWCSAWSMRASR
jgi:hypothetical protein